MTNKLPSFSDAILNNRIKDLKDKFMTDFKTGFVALLNKDFPNFKFGVVTLPGDAFVIDSKEKYYVTYKDRVPSQIDGESSAHKDCSVYIVSEDTYKPIIEDVNVSNAVGVIGKRAYYLAVGRPNLIMKAVKKEVLDIVNSAMGQSHTSFNKMLSYIENYVEETDEDAEAYVTAPLVKDLLKDSYDSDTIAVILNCCIIEMKKECKDTLLLSETPDFINTNYAITD